MIALAESLREFAAVMLIAGGLVGVAWLRGKVLR